MSLTSTDPQRIAYRRLLSSFANALDSENIQKIVYIYSGDSNIDSSEKGCAFHLLLKIERLNYFSFENPSPLVQIAEDAGRLDWAEKFKEYVETRATAPPPKSITKKRSSPIPSEERRYLEDVHDVLVSKVVDLEEQFQEMWKKEVVTKEEGMKLLRKSEKIIINDIQGELRKGMKKLQTRPNSGYSSSGSSSGSELSTSPTYTMPTTKSTVQHRVDRNKPIPKPRKPRPPPPYRSQQQQGTDLSYKVAVQESTRHNSPLLRAPLLSGNENHTHDNMQPPPIPPKKHNSPSLTSKHQRRSGTSQMCFTTPHVCMPLQRKLSDEEKQVMMEENDMTGDSGKGTGSGEYQYGSLEEWRQAITNPPPEEKEHLYTKVREEMTDEDHAYEPLTPNPLSEKNDT